MITIHGSRVYQAMLELRGVTQSPINIAESDEVSYNAHMFYRANKGGCKNDSQRKLVLEVGYEASYLVTHGRPRNFTSGKDIGVGEKMLPKKELVAKANELIKNRLRFLSFGEQE